MNTPTHFDVYTIVTNRIIAQLEQSIIPGENPGQRPAIHKTS